jgi:hypothetical protein
MQKSRSDRSFSVGQSGSQSDEGFRLTLGASEY